MKWYFTEKAGETGPGPSSASLDRRSPQHGHNHGKTEQQPVRKEDLSGTLQKKKFTAVLQKTLQAGAQKSSTP